MNRYTVSYGGYQVKQGQYFGLANSQGLPKAVIAPSRLAAFKLLADAFHGPAVNGLPTDITVSWGGEALPVEPTAGLEY